MVKEKLLLPFVDLTLEYYDLSLANRDLTDDKVVLEGAEAVKVIFIGLARICATWPGFRDLARLFY